MEIFVEYYLQIINGIITIIISCLLIGYYLYSYTILFLKYFVVFIIIIDFVYDLFNDFPVMITIPCKFSLIHIPKNNPIMFLLRIFDMLKTIIIFLNIDYVS